jgi:hypothetical protein
MSELSDDLLNWIVADVIVVGSMASLKVIKISLFLATPVAPLAGFTAVMVGGVVSWACVTLFEETTTPQETRIPKIIRKQRLGI